MGNARTITEVRGKAGDGIGMPDPGFVRGDAAPFTVAQILDKDHVKVRIAGDLVFREPEKHATGKEAILRRGEKLWIATESWDAGIDYVLQISGSDHVPSVKADDPRVVAAITAHANVTMDDFGSVQEIEPPGLIAPGKHGKGGRNWGWPGGFDPARVPPTRI